MEGERDQQTRQEAEHGQYGRLFKHDPVEIAVGEPHRLESRVFGAVVLHVGREDLHNDDRANEKPDNRAEAEDETRR